MVSQNTDGRRHQCTQTTGAEMSVKITVTPQLQRWKPLYEETGWQHTTGLLQNSGKTGRGRKDQLAAAGKRRKKIGPDVPYDDDEVFSSCIK
jgi:hypothetical protein